MDWRSVQQNYRQEMETEMRNETHLDRIATIIQIGHVNKLTSEQIAADVLEYATSAGDVFTWLEATD
jgi:hypothetical protein